ncbi:Short-chain dehydrogenase [Geodermatophilus obscurus]|uniref:Short-chain dehydrogenase n=1 Tax=Geodermatophilus obscurus TaxID=1861 RepID=A0A1I5DK18_9ACTN|nr:SDR family NAD(P)-dependent oxidoreductase [Geodermatophilus obscurus]SFN99520.1 Short-chain dehydrogenase [Geodermatophilus obscurus]
MRALVTGASSGIGRATAAALVARGHSVLGASRDPDRLAPADRVPRVEYAALDLTDPAAVEAFAGRLADVDVLVNAAGESQSGPLEGLPAEALERLFRLDVLAPVRLTQLALPGMRAPGHGRVVMVGSMPASFPLAHHSSYVATEAAIRGFADAARLELSPFSVHITTVEPGSVSTGIGQRRTTYVADGSPYADDVATMLAVLDRNEAAGTVLRMVARRHGPRR